MLRKDFELLRTEELKPVHPVSIYDYSNIETAFRSVQNGNHIGKIVLKATKDSVVPAVSTDSHPLTLNPNATYVLAGGLGGLSRGLALYMADHGAKHLTFFTRSDEVRLEARTTLDLLKNKGVQTAVYACDVGDEESLKSTLAKMARETPPVKGIIQGAMVLQDGLFERMPYKNWVTATYPKIQGSWNLHKFMPKDLDFFILLSSIAGILGNRGQSNYCAGNIYQDQLAHYRVANGLPALCVDLGAIGGIGWFEENKEGLALAKTMEKLIISKDEFFCILKAAMTGYSAR